MSEQTPMMHGDEVIRAEALGNMRGEDVNDDQVWALLQADAQAEWDDQPLRCTAYPEFCGCPQS